MILTSAILLEAEGNAALAEVIRGHFDIDPVPSQHTDAVLAHFTARMGEDGMLVIQRDAEHGVGQKFGYRTSKLDQVFFRHEYPLQEVGKNCAGHTASLWKSPARSLVMTAHYVRGGGDDVKVFCWMEQDQAGVLLPASSTMPEPSGAG